MGVYLTLIYTVHTLYTLYSTLTYLSVYTTYAPQLLKEPYVEGTPYTHSQLCNVHLYNEHALFRPLIP